MIACYYLSAASRSIVRELLESFMPGVGWEHDQIYTLEWFLWLFYRWCISGPKAWSPGRKGLTKALRRREEIWEFYIEKLGCSAWKGREMEKHSILFCFCFITSPHFKTILIRCPTRTWDSTSPKLKLPRFLPKLLPIPNSLSQGQCSCPLSCPN